MVRGLRTHRCWLVLGEGSWVSELSQRWALSLLGTSWALRTEVKGKQIGDCLPCPGREGDGACSEGWGGILLTAPYRCSKAGDLGAGEDSRGLYHFPSASWGAAEEMREGKAGPGQGSSSENGGSKVQRGICLSHLLAKGHREADWWRENKARIFQ